MQHTTVTVSVETDKSARIEGARQLGVQPDDVNVVPVDEQTYAVSIRSRAGCLPWSWLENYWLAEE